VSVEVAQWQLQFHPVLSYMGSSYVQEDSNDYLHSHKEPHNPEQVDQNQGLAEQCLDHLATIDNKSTVH
jgi:hypothetical protein